MVTFWNRLSCLLFGHIPFQEHERRGFLPLSMTIQNGENQEFIPEGIEIHVKCCGRCGVMYVAKVVEHDHSLDTEKHDNF
jgi:hypothetical protein